MYLGIYIKNTCKTEMGENREHKQKNFIQVIAIVLKIKYYKIGIIF